MMSNNRQTVFDALGRHPIHPFPARMAPGIALNALSSAQKPLRVLDPMMGSGTVLAMARAHGHYAMGVDVDQLEKLAKEGVVHSYARNDRLEFNIPYELYGNPHVYEPDFIVRLRNSVNVVLEIKGKTQEDTDAKTQAAKRWVSAVNHWGSLGEWDFLICREPQLLGTELAKLVATRTERVRTVAANLQSKAEDELKRLRALGWTQADFAKALRGLLEGKEAD